MKISLIASLLLCLASNSFAQSKPIIVLDTGHTPEVPGVIAANGVPEFEYNRNFVQQLKQELTNRGWHVHDVREHRQDTSLTSRVTQTLNANLFLSIHHDSMQQAWLDAGYRNNYSGFSIFTSRKNPNFNTSVKCASYIGNSLIESGEKPSLYHAADYPGERKQLVDQQAGVHVYDNLVVLKHAKSPAVLLEIGVVVNESEAARLQQQNTIKTAAHAVALGLDNCK